MTSYFDFTATFEKIGGLFRKRLRRSFETQTDLQGRTFARPALATLKARARLLTGTKSGSKKGMTLKGTARTGKKGAVAVKSVPLTRLYVTRDLALRGFQADAASDNLRVFVSPDAHIPFYGSNPTLAEIVGWNSKGQPDLNPRVGIKAPLVFPTSTDEVNRIEPEISWAHKMLDDDAFTQAKERLKFKLEQELKL